MNQFRYLLAVAFLMGTANAFAVESQPGVAAVKKSFDRPLPISASASPTRFNADGKQHGPKIEVSPKEATVKVTGTTSATEPGTYTVNVVATGKYTGTFACQWTIVAQSQSAGVRFSGVRSAPSSHVVTEVEVKPIVRRRTSTR